MHQVSTNLLSKKVIVITGGAGLIGRELVTGLLKEGATVVVADSNQHSLDFLAKNLGQSMPDYQVFFKQLDITSKESIITLINYLDRKLGRIDGLVNNAYPRNKNYGRKFPEVEYTDFCENLSMHLGGYFLSSQQFSKYFERKGGGNIVNMSSIYGLRAPRFQVYDATEMTMPIEYAAIKSAIIHITRYMAQYFKGKNIRVNCISPGGIIAEQPKEFLDAYNSYGASKGMLEPKDLTGTLVYLLSDLSKFVNGQNIVVDDGWIL